MGKNNQSISRYYRNEMKNEIKEKMELNLNLKIDYSNSINSIKISIFDDVK